MATASSDSERITGVRTNDIVGTYSIAQAIFRSFPTMTDEQMRHHAGLSCPFERSHGELFHILTRRATAQAQFKDILLKYHEAATKMLDEDAAYAANGTAALKPVSDPKQVATAQNM
jgi:hypothetical protein